MEGLLQMNAIMHGACSPKVLCFPKLRRRDVREGSFGYHHHHHHHHHHHRHHYGCLQSRQGRGRSSNPLPVAAAKTDIAEIRKELMEEEVAQRAFRVEDLSTEEGGGVQDWHPGIVVNMRELVHGVREVVVETEVSREMVSLEKAYTKPGQLSQVRLPGGNIVKVVASSSPFPVEVNEAPHYKARGDIISGSTKVAKYYISVKAPVHLHVLKADSSALFDAKEGDEVEIGPFEETGLDLRPVMHLHRVRTLLFFASGKGIAVVKAIIEAQDSAKGSLNLNFRQDVRLYYWSPKPSLVAYKESFDKWRKRKVKVCQVVGSACGEDWNDHVGSFSSLWDDDDIEYDPETTGVVVCVEESEADEVKSLLANADILEEKVVMWNV